MVLPSANNGFGGMGDPFLDLKPGANQGLTQDVWPREYPQTQLWRRYYGRGIDLVAIENAMRSAQVGLMGNITDLAHEVRGTDPHLVSVLGKRIGAITCAPRRLDPARGPDVDLDLARDAVETVNLVLRKIPNFSNKLYTLAWALYFGRGALEIHWQPCTPFGEAPFTIKWMPVELRFIPQRNLSFGPERELRIIDPTRAQGYFRNTDGVAIRDYPGKFITWTPQLFGELPEREGLAPGALYWSFFKRFTWRMRMMLTELFGIPWRIVSAKEGATVGFDQLQSARAAAEALGAETTAQLAPGINLDVVMPKDTMSQFFGMTSQEVNAEMSKYVLGQTGTTDGGATGMASDMGKMMKGEQNEIATRDAGDLDEVLTDQLIRFIALVNWGPEAAELYRPQMVIDVSPPRDRVSDLANAKTASSMGVPVSVAEVREIAGLRVPEEGEELVKPPASPIPGAPGEGGDVPPPPPKPGASDPPVNEGEQVEAARALRTMLEANGDTDGLAELAILEKAAKRARLAPAFGGW